MSVDTDTEKYYYECLQTKAILFAGYSNSNNPEYCTDILMDSRGKIKYSIEDKFFLLSIKIKTADDKNYYQYRFKRKCENNDNVFYIIDLNNLVTLLSGKEYEFKIVENLIFNSPRTHMISFVRDYFETHRHLRV